MTPTPHPYYVRTPRNRHGESLVGPCQYTIRSVHYPQVDIVAAGVDRAAADADCARLNHEHATSLCFAADI